MICSMIIIKLKVIKEWIEISKVEDIQKKMKEYCSNSGKRVERKVIQSVKIRLGNNKINMNEVTLKRTL